MLFDQNCSWNLIPLPRNNLDRIIILCQALCATEPDRVEWEQWVVTGWGSKCQYCPGQCILSGIFRSSYTGVDDSYVCIDLWYNYNFYGRILIARLYTEELGTVLGQHLFGDEKWVILDVKWTMSLQPKEYDLSYKVLLIGESTVGKSSLIRCYSKPDQAFTSALMPTYGE